MKPPSTMVHLRKATDSPPNKEKSSSSSGRTIQSNAGVKNARTLCLEGIRSSPRRHTPLVFVVGVVVGSLLALWTSSTTHNSVSVVTRRTQSSPATSEALNRRRAVEARPNSTEGPLLEKEKLQMPTTAALEISDSITTMAIDEAAASAGALPQANPREPTSQELAIESSTDIRSEPSLESPRPHRIPTILLAGTQKASTSAVAVYLMKRNDTCFSDPDQGEEGGHGKEAHFFDLKFNGGLQQYQDLFAKCSQEDDNVHLIDGTPETMLHPQRVRDIYQQAGMADDVRIIFILREPIARSISWYNHQLRYARLPNRPFWTNGIVGKHGRIKSYIQHQRETVVVNFKHRQYDKLYGYYAYWLKEWSRLFDRSSQILVLSYSELVHNPQRMLRRIHDFLNIPYPIEEDGEPPMELTYENTNEHKTPPPPCQHQWEMAKYFEQPNRELYQFLQNNPGPIMEERPFPRFQLACQHKQQQQQRQHQGQSAATQ